MTHLAIVPPDDPNDEELAKREGLAEREQVEQVYEADRVSRLPADAFLRHPRKPVQDTLGGIAPGTTTVAIGPSGNGKTTYVMDMIDELEARGDRPFVIGTESPAPILRMMLAARREGIDFSEVRTGVAQQRANWPDLRARLNRRFREQVTNAALARIRFASGTFLDPKFLDRAIAQAVDFGAGAVFIDHLDNLGGEGRRSPYETSLANMSKILVLTQKHGLRVIATSQTNLAGMANDPLRNHRPIRRESVRNGGFKLEMADTAIGIFRPLRRDLDRGTLQDWRDGRVDTTRILEPNTCALNIMKHRADGSCEGKRIYLGYSKGRLLDTPPAHGDQDQPSPWYDRG